LGSTPPPPKKKKSISQIISLLRTLASPVSGRMLVSIYQAAKYRIQKVSITTVTNVVYVVES